MKRRTIITGLSLVASAGLGIVAGIVIWGRLREGSGGPNFSQPRVLRGLPPGDTESLLDMCRVHRRAKGLGLLVRSNAHAAEAMIRLRKRQPCVGPIVMHAYTGSDGGILVDAIEAGPHRSAVVLMFTDEKGRLVHYSHPVDPASYAAGCAYGVCLGWSIGATRQTLADCGTLGKDGVIYVQTSDLKENPEKIRIPDGEVAVGLRYPDGSYSNFVPLERPGEGSHRNER